MTLPYIINSAGRNGGSVDALCPSRRSLVDGAAKRTFEVVDGVKEKMTVEQRIASWNINLPKTVSVVPRRRQGWGGGKNHLGSEKRGSRSGPINRRGAYKVRNW